VNTVNKKIVSVLGIFLIVGSLISGSVLVHLSASSEPNVILSVEPEVLNVERNQVFELEIHIANVKELYKWMLTEIRWDSAVIELYPDSASAFREGPFLSSVDGTLFMPSLYKAGSGYLSYISCELMQPVSVSGNGILLTIKFKAICDGETDVTIGNSFIDTRLKNDFPHMRKMGHIIVRSVVHNLSVSIESPPFLILGNYASLCAKVENLGTADETNIDIHILINGTVVNQTVTRIQVNSSYLLSYRWTPLLEGTYNVTAIAAPMIGETRYRSSLVNVLPNIHDIAVSLTCPERIAIGRATTLNLTAVNCGAFNETEVKFRLTIVRVGSNDTINNNWNISLLARGTSWSNTSQWKPLIEGTYEVTVEAYVARDDNGTNNVRSVTVKAVNSTKLDILVVSSDGGIDSRHGTSLEEFEEALTSANLDYDVWSKSVNGTIEDANVLDAYKLVIWTCGDFCRGMINPRKEQKALLDYFNRGGNILFEGERLVSDLAAARSIAKQFGFKNYYYPILEEMLFVSYESFVVEATTGIEPIYKNLITRDLTAVNWSMSPTWGPNGVKTFGKACTVIRYPHTNYSAVSIADGTDVGTGSVVYYSFSLFSLPRNYRDILVQNSIRWFNRFGVSVVASRIIHSPLNSVYFVYGNLGERTDMEFSAMAGGMFYALLENEQLQGFADNVNISEPDVKLVSLFGNPSSNEIVEHYNTQGMLPLILYQNSNDLLFKNSRGETIYEHKTQGSGNQSVFVIQAFSVDNIDFLVVYGSDWKGTWAAGIYLSRFACKDLSNYSDAYYLCEWKDQNKDSIPQVDEISILASG
jgi:hypothetical protein